MSLTSSISKFVRNNAPSAKPELWSGLPGSLFRNVEMRISGRSKVCEIQVEPRAKFRADTGTSIGHSLYVYRCWEYPVTRLFNSLLRSSTVFFDIGANIGYFTVLAAAKCKEVCAFEPVPAIFKELQANISINRFTNVDARSIAVCNRDGHVPFYVVENENTGLSSLVGFSGGMKMMVASLRLDSFVRTRRSQQVDLLKIDVEGAEDQVIQGARETLSSSIAPDIIFECHPNASSDRLLVDLGYKVYALRQQRSYEAPNLFATKREQTTAVMRQLRSWQ